MTFTSGMEGRAPKLCTYSFTVTGQQRYIYISRLTSARDCCLALEQESLCCTAQSSGHKSQHAKQPFLEDGLHATTTFGAQSY